MSAESRSRNWSLPMSRHLRFQVLLGVLTILAPTCWAQVPTATAPSGSTKAAGAKANVAKEATAAGGGMVKLDPALPDYKPSAGVAGNIKSVGSDTMNNLMTL